MEYLSKSYLRTIAVFFNIGFIIIEIYTVIQVWSYLNGFTTLGIIWMMLFCLEKHLINFLKIWLFHKKYSK